MQLYQMIRCQSDEIIILKNYLDKPGKFSKIPMNKTYNFICLNDLILSY